MYQDAPIKTYTPQQLQHLYEVTKPTLLKMLKEVEGLRAPAEGTSYRRLYFPDEVARIFAKFGTPKILTS